MDAEGRGGWVGQKERKEGMLWSVCKRNEKYVIKKKETTPSVLASKGYAPTFSCTYIYAQINLESRSFNLVGYYAKDQIQFASTVK